MWESLPPLVITSPGLRDTAASGHHTPAVRVADVVGLFDDSNATSMTHAMSQTQQQQQQQQQSAHASQAATPLATSTPPSAPQTTPRTASTGMVDQPQRDDRDAHYDPCGTGQQDSLLLSDQQTYERFAQVARAKSARADRDEDEGDSPLLYGAGATSYSFYKGTAGTGNLVRSFYFPSSSPITNNASPTAYTPTTRPADHSATASANEEVASTSQDTAAAASPFVLHSAPSFFSPTAWDRTDSFDKLRTAAPLAATSVSSVPSDTAAAPSVIPLASAEATGKAGSSAGGVSLARRTSAGSVDYAPVDQGSPVASQQQLVTPRTLLRTVNELEQMLAAFKARCDAYHNYKNSCTESYLGEIEAAVDDYLVRHFRGTRVTAAGGGNVAMNGLTKAGAKLFQMGNTLLRAYANVPSSTDNNHTNISPNRSASEGDKASRDAVAASGLSTVTNVVATPSTGATSDGVGNTVGDAAGGGVASASPAPAATAQPVTTLHYTADVISAHYLDERPSLAAMRCIVENYPILLYVLRNVFAPTAVADTTATSQTSDGRPRQGSIGGDTTVDAAAATSATHGCDAGSSYDAAEHARLRERLFVPTIDTVWNRYLSPLEEKALELLHIAKVHLQPAVEQWKRQASQPTATSTRVEGVARVAFAEEKGSDDAMAVLALQLHVQGLVQQVEKRLRGLQNDIQYIDTLRDMDKAFVAERPGWREAVAQSCHGRLSEYVPVYGLLLSRLHRLEMEHRTVLEVWASTLQPALKQKA